MSYCGLLRTSRRGKAAELVALVPPARCIEGTNALAPKETPIEASLRRLKDIVDRLRSPGGCPWDLEQTPESLKPFLLEEAHEVADAIDAGVPSDLREELGDLLMNIFLQARIAEEREQFTLGEIADGIADKLIRRHPHVFGEGEAEDSSAVRRNWEAIKKQEKGDQPDPGAIRPLPASLPALSRGERVGRMAADVGFDWPDAEGPLAKIREEVEELCSAHQSGQREQTEAELGDLLFAITSFARHAEIDSEAALKRALERFTQRFRHVEPQLTEGDARAPVDAEHLAELERLWQDAKRRESE